MQKVKVTIKHKAKEKPKTKKVYYAIVNVIEVPANYTDEQVDDILMIKATKNGTLDEGRDYMWSYDDDLLYDSKRYI